jgi:hypothetical protein
MPNMHPGQFTRGLRFHESPRFNKIYPMRRMMSVEIEVAGLLSNRVGTCQCRAGKEARAREAMEADIQSAIGHTRAEYVRTWNRENNYILLPEAERPYNCPDWRHGPDACGCFRPRTSDDPEPTTSPREVDEARIRRRYTLNDYMPSRCECVGLEFKALGDKWGISCVGDGSLPPSGFELNTAPAGGDKFAEQITEICAVLSRYTAYADDTCGLHIHADARDINWFDLRRVILYYAIVEPTLFKMVTERRRNGSYTRPCGAKLANAIIIDPVPSVADTKNRLLHTIYGFDMKANREEADNPWRSKTSKRQILKSQAKNLKDAKEQKYATSRYNALNIHSWLHRGSLEWRMPAGSVSKEQIFSWAKLYSEILSAATRAKESTLREVYASAIAGHRPVDAGAAMLKKTVSPESFDFIVERREYCRRHNREYTGPYCEDSEPDHDRDDDCSCGDEDCSTCNP